MVVLVCLFYLDLLNLSHGHVLVLINENTKPLAYLGYMYQISNYIYGF